MTYTRSETKTFFWFLAAAIAGPILLWNSVGDLFTGWRSRSWPKTEATILDAAVRSRESGRRFSKSTKYEPKIAYEYQINGETFQSDRMAFTEDSISSMEEATAVLKRLIKGPKITIYYDPRQPGSAVIITGATGGQWTKLLIGLALLGFAFVIGRKYWHALQKTTLQSRDGGF